MIDDGFAEARASDLRSVSIHECAHCQVALHYGLIGRVSIVPNPKSDQLPGVDVSVLGSFNVEGADGKTRPIIALAGQCAETFKANRRVTGPDIFAALRSEQIKLSETDRANAGDYTERDVTESLEIVKARWQTIVEDADREAKAFNLKYRA